MTSFTDRRYFQSLLLPKTTHDLGLKTSIQTFDAFVRYTPMGNQPWPQFQNGIRERSTEKRLKIIDFFSFRPKQSQDNTVEQFLNNYARALLSCDLKKIVTESFAITDMTAVTSAVLFHSESEGSGFHDNERP